MNNLIFAIAALFGIGIVTTAALALVPGDHSTTVGQVSIMVLTGAGFLIHHFKQVQLIGKVEDNTRLTFDAKKEANMAAEAAKEAATTSAIAINGRVEQLVEEAREAGYAKGKAEGQTLAEEVQEQIARRVQEQVHRHQQRNEEQLKVLRDTIEELKRKKTEDR